MRRTLCPRLVSALLLAAALGACSRGKDAAPAASPEPASGSRAAAGTAAEGDAITVTTEPVAVQRVDRTVDFVGTLRANAEAEVATEVDGRLLTIDADLGDQVAAGQVLASLDSATLEAQLREAAANLQKSTTEEARARRLKDQGVMSQQEFDTLSSAQSVALARRDVLAIHLGHTKIRAPFAGRIAKRMVDVGNYVRVGMPIFVLVADDPLRLRGEVPERFVAELAVGQDVRGSVEAYPDEVLQGRLARISAAADSASRALTVEALVPNPSGKLKVGFFCKAAILTRTASEALVIPAEALVNFAGVTRVFVIGDDGTARSREVRTGLALGPKVEVLSGLERDDRVATSALARLSEGTKVVVRAAGRDAEKPAEASVRAAENRS
jgi:membrane fusion protein (multidrug efflux system)